MKNPKFTHIIVDIHSFDSYFKNKEKMIGMKIGDIEADLDMNNYNGNFSLSEEDNATLNLKQHEHNFYNAKLALITHQTEREDIKQRLARTGDEDLLDDAMTVRAGW